MFSGLGLESYITESPKHTILPKDDDIILNTIPTAENKSLTMADKQR